MIKRLAPLVVAVWLAQQPSGLRIIDSAKPPTPPQPSSGLLQKSQLHLEGFIRLPSGQAGISKFDSAGVAPGIAFNPFGDNGKGSLFVAGTQTDANIGDQSLAEVTIPTPGATRSVAPVAAFLQPFAAPDEGVIDRDTPHGGAAEPWHVPIQLGGYAVGPDRKLYMTWYVYYDASNRLAKFILRRPIDLADRGHVEGGLGPAGQSCLMGGAMAAIPDAWRPKLLNKVFLSGMTSVPIASRCSMGPSAFGWDPAVDWNINGDLRATALMAYPNEAGKRLATYEGVADQIAGGPLTQPRTDDTPFWSGGFFFGHGMVIPEGHDTLLQFYVAGMSQWSYGLGVDTYIHGFEAKGMYPPDPPVHQLPAPSWDDATAGAKASTGPSGTRIFIPDLVCDTNDDTALPIDQGRAIWLKDQVTPAQNPGALYVQRLGVANIIGKGNCGTVSAYVDTNSPFPPNLTGQRFRVGKLNTYDPPTLGQGNHAPPYHVSVFATDLNQLAQVASGTRQAYNVIPYALWDLQKLVYEANQNNDFGWSAALLGVTSDPKTRRIFVLLVGGDPTNNTNIVVVLKYD